MADAPKTDPIPVRLCDAFERAVLGLEDWDRGGPEPLIALEGQAPVTIDMVCGFVLPFPDLAPQGIYDAIDDLAHSFRHGIEGLGHHACEGPANNSYASLARCLLGLYEARKARYDRRSKT
jgi:hypothetical protein